MSFIAKRSQDAVNAFRPYFENYPVFRGSRLEDYMAATPLTVGSPQQVIDKVLTFQEGFGDYQRQLFAVDGLALPVEVALEQVELLGTEVVPVLRKELESRRAPDVPDAPTHASLVAAKYGDAEPRQPRPNPNRGDNLSGTSPYQDSDPDVAGPLPAAVLVMSRRHPARQRGLGSAVPGAGHPRAASSSARATGATCSPASTACSTRCRRRRTGCG